MKKLLYIVVPIVMLIGIATRNTTRTEEIHRISLDITAYSEEAQQLERYMLLHSDQDLTKEAQRIVEIDHKTDSLKKILKEQYGLPLK